MRHSRFPERPQAPVSSSSKSPRASKVTSGDIHIKMKDNDAPVILKGGVGQAEKAMSFILREFPAPANFFSVDLIVLETHQKWCIFVPIVDELAVLVNLWSRHPRLSSKKQLGQWIMESCKVEFKGLEIVGSQFDQKSLMWKCVDEIARVQCTMAVKIQAFSRGWMVRRKKLQSSFFDRSFYTYSSWAKKRAKTKPTDGFKVISISTPCAISPYRDSLPHPTTMPRIGRIDDSRPAYTPGVIKPVIQDHNWLGEPERRSVSAGGGDRKWRSRHHHSKRYSNRPYLSSSTRHRTTSPSRVKSAHGSRRGPGPGMRDCMYSELRSVNLWDSHRQKLDEGLNDDREESTVLLNVAVNDRAVPTPTTLYSLEPEESLVRAAMNGTEWSILTEQGQTPELPQNQSGSWTRNTHVRHLFGESIADSQHASVWHGSVVDNMFMTGELESIHYAGASTYPDSSGDRARALLHDDADPKYIGDNPVVPGLNNQRQWTAWVRLTRALSNYSIRVRRRNRRKYVLDNIDGCSDADVVREGLALCLLTGDISMAYKSLKRILKALLSYINDDGTTDISIFSISKKGMKMIFKVMMCFVSTSVTTVGVDLLYQISTLTDVVDIYDHMGAAGACDVIAITLSRYHNDTKVLSLVLKLCSRITCDCSANRRLMLTLSHGKVFTNLITEYSGNSDMLERLLRVLCKLCASEKDIMENLPLCGIYGAVMNCLILHYKEPSFVYMIARSIMIFCSSKHPQAQTIFGTCDYCAVYVHCLQQCRQDERVYKQVASTIISVCGKRFDNLANISSDYLVNTLLDILRDKNALEEVIKCTVTLVHHLCCYPPLRSNLLAGGIENELQRIGTKYDLKRTLADIEVLRSNEDSGSPSAREEHCDMPIRSPLKALTSLSPPLMPSTPEHLKVGFKNKPAIEGTNYKNVEVHGNELSNRIIEGSSITPSTPAEVQNVAVKETGHGENTVEFIRQKLSAVDSVDESHDAVFIVECLELSVELDSTSLALRALRRILNILQHTADNASAEGIGQELVTRIDVLVTAISTFSSQTAVQALCIAVLQEIPCSEDEWNMIGLAGIYDCLFETLRKHTDNESVFIPCVEYLTQLSCTVANRLLATTPDHCKTLMMVMSAVVKQNQMMDQCCGLVRVLCTESQEGLCRAGVGSQVVKYLLENKRLPSIVSECGETICALALSRSPSCLQTLASHKHIRLYVHIMKSNPQSDTVSEIVYNIMTSLCGDGVGVFAQELSKSCITLDLVNILKDSSATTYSPGVIQNTLLLVIYLLQKVPMIHSDFISTGVRNSLSLYCVEDTWSDEVRDYAKHALCLLGTYDSAPEIRKYAEAEGSGEKNGNTSESQERTTFRKNKVKSDNASDSRMHTHTEESTVKSGNESQKTTEADLHSVRRNEDCVLEKRKNLSPLELVKLEASRRLSEAKELTEPDKSQSPAQLIDNNVRGISNIEDPEIDSGHAIESKVSHKESFEDNKANLVDHKGADDEKSNLVSPKNSDDEKSNLVSPKGSEDDKPNLADHKGADEKRSNLVNHKGSEHDKPNLVDHKGADDEKSILVDHKGSDEEKSNLVDHKGSEHDKPNLVDHKGADDEKSNLVDHKGSDDEKDIPIATRPLTLAHVSSASTISIVAPKNRSPNNSESRTPSLRMRSPIESIDSQRSNRNGGLVTPDYTRRFGHSVSSTSAIPVEYSMADMLDGIDKSCKAEFISNCLEKSVSQSSRKLALKALARTKVVLQESDKNTIDLPLVQMLLRNSHILLNILETFSNVVSIQVLCFDIISMLPYGEGDLTRIANAGAFGILYPVMQNYVSDRSVFVPCVEYIRQLASDCTSSKLLAGKNGSCDLISNVMGRTIKDTEMFGVCCKLVSAMCSDCRSNQIAFSQSGIGGHIIKHLIEYKRDVTVVKVCTNTILSLCESGVEQNLKALGSHRHLKLYVHLVRTNPDDSVMSKVVCKFLATLFTHRSATLTSEMKKGVVVSDIVSILKDGVTTNKYGSQLITHTLTFTAVLVRNFSSLRSEFLAGDLLNTLELYNELRWEESVMKIVRILIKYLTSKDSSTGSKPSRALDGSFGTV